MQAPTMSIRSIPIALIVALCGLMRPATACPYSIRDAGFIVREPTPYKLYVYLDGSRHDAAAARDALKKAARRLELSESNVAVECIDIHSQADHKAMRYLPDGASLPSAALVSSSDRVFPIGHVKQALDEPGARGFVASVVSTETRENVARYVLDGWCVVLLVEGSDAAGNAQARRAVEEAARGVVGLRTEMARIERAPHVVVMGPGASGDPVLAWGLGLATGRQAEPQAAVVFGMGRRLGPALGGEAITTDALAGLFQLLGTNCTCTSDPSSLMGPAAPLVWGLSRQQAVMDTLGFDPNSPAVATTLSGVWRTIGELDAAGSRGIEMGPGAGYSEFALDSLTSGTRGAPPNRVALSRRVAQAPPAPSGPGAGPWGGGPGMMRGPMGKGPFPGPGGGPGMPPGGLHGGPGGPRPQAPPAPDSGGESLSTLGVTVPGVTGGAPGAPPAGEGAPGMEAGVPGMPPMAFPGALPDTSGLPPLRYVPVDDPDFYDPNNPMAPVAVATAEMPPGTGPDGMPLMDSGGPMPPDGAAPPESADAPGGLAPAGSETVVPAETGVESSSRRVLVVVLGAVSLMALAAAAIIVIVSLRSR